MPRGPMSRNDQSRVSWEPGNQARRDVLPLLESPGTLHRSVFYGFAIQGLKREAYGFNGPWMLVSLGYNPLTRLASLRGFAGYVLGC